MSSIEQVLEQLKVAHYVVPQLNSNRVLEFETHLGYSLPSDMHLFYERYDGARLFSEDDPPYRIFGLSDLKHPASYLLGTTRSQGPTESWLAFCDVRDGNYVAIDLKDGKDGRAEVRDCFHETFPDPEYCGVIAYGFQEFLEKAMASGGSLFWL